MSRAGVQPCEQTWVPGTRQPESGQVVSGKTQQAWGHHAQLCDDEGRAGPHRWGRRCQEDRGSRREHLHFPLPTPTPPVSAAGRGRGPCSSGPLHMLFPLPGLPFPLLEKPLQPSSPMPLLQEVSALPVPAHPVTGPALPTLPHLCSFKTFLAPDLLTFGSAIPLDQTY